MPRATGKLSGNPAVTGTPGTLSQQFESALDVEIAKYRNAVPLCDCLRLANAIGQYELIRAAYINGEGQWYRLSFVDGSVADLLDNYEE